MKRLIECVPNFSEGRDAAKVDALIDAMRGVPGVLVLDRESDADHNRSVVTLAGEPYSVAEAVLRGIGKATELIDLTRHTGAHPRIGATDVVPLIPIEGCTIEDCVALARRVGERLKLFVLEGEQRAQSFQPLKIAAAEQRRVDAPEPRGQLGRAIGAKSRLDQRTGKRRRADGGRRVP